MNGKAVGPLADAGEIQPPACRDERADGRRLDDRVCLAGWTASVDQAPRNDPLLLSRRDGRHVSQPRRNVVVDEAQELSRGVSLLACCGKRTQKRHNNSQKCAKVGGPASVPHRNLPKVASCLFKNGVQSCALAPGSNLRPQCFAHNWLQGQVSYSGKNLFGGTTPGGERAGPAASRECREQITQVELHGGVV